MLYYLLSWLKGFSYFKYNDFSFIYMIDHSQIQVLNYEVTKLIELCNLNRSLGKY